MKELSMKKEFSIIKDFLAGGSYDSVAAKNGVAKGSVSNVIAGLRAGCFPEFADAADLVDALRELSLDLKAANLTPGKCAVGLIVLKRMSEYELQPSDMERWPAILKHAKSDADTQEFVQTIYRIQDFEKKAGLSPTEIGAKITELEQQASHLEPLLKQVAQQEEKFLGLSEQVDQLQAEVQKLEQQRSFLSPIVMELEKRQAALLQQIKQEETVTVSTQAGLAAWHREQKKLARTGFTLDGLADFNDKARAIAARHHVPVADLKKRLMNDLTAMDKLLGLEGLVHSTESRHLVLQKAVASAEQECETRNRTIARLNKEQAALEAGIQATREKVGAEIARLIPLARETLEQVAANLKQGNREILEDLRHVRDESLMIGQELGRYQGIVEAHGWLSDLEQLITGSENIEPIKVRAILLLVLRGLRTWVNANRLRVKCPPAPAIDLMIGELEGWQT